MDLIEQKAYIFGSIFTLANRLQVLGDKFDDNLTIKQWLLLVGIFKNESVSPTISEVASIIGNSRQNIKKMALILEKEGFLQLKKDNDDARILRINLTEKCKEYFKQRAEREAEFIEQLFDAFDANLLVDMDKGMKKLEENIIKMEKQYGSED